MHLSVAGGQMQLVGDIFILLIHLIWALNQFGLTKISEAIAQEIFFLL